MSGADAWAVTDPTTCPECGRDSCEDHLPPVQPSTATVPAFISAANVIATPQPLEIVEGIAWAGCRSVLVSESGAGKTFVLLDLAGSVSAGLPFHGRRTEQGSVAYLSYEGDALGLRLRALRDVRKQCLEHVYVLRASDPLSPRVTREGEERSRGELVATQAIEALVETIAQAGKPPISVTIVDTIRASLSGSEDSSEHVSAYLRAVHRLMVPVPGAAVILAHHAGWQDGETQRKRERGSSALRGNCDATLYLEAGDYDHERGEAPLTLRALKVRDAERPAPLHLVRRRVELSARDRHGQPVTSCVIESDRRTPTDRESEAAAAVQIEQRAFDLKALRVVKERPELATSQDRIRLVLGVRKTLVSDSMSRLIGRGWVLPGHRKQPYQVTDAGRTALAEVQP